MIAVFPAAKAGGGSDTRGQAVQPRIAYTEQPQIRYARAAGGGHVAYYSMGEGPPLVVTSKIQWGHLGNTLGFPEARRNVSGKGVGRGLTIVRYDDRGTGLSDREPVDFSWEARRASLEAVIDALHLDRFALLGIRNGCLTAIPYAAEFPERVSHLVLVSPYVRGQEHPVLSSLLAGVTPVAGMSASQWQRYTESAARLVTGYSLPRVADFIATAYADSMTPEAFLAFNAFRAHVDLSAYLERITVPTLVIQRRYKDAAPLELEVAERIPQARLLSVGATGPIRELWHEEETEAIEEFLGVAPTSANERFGDRGDGRLGGVSDALRAWAVEPTYESSADQPPDEATSSNSDHLTRREVEVLRLIAAGQTSKEISRNLSLSIRTVGRHITNIYEKIGARSRADATAYAVRHRIAIE
jgi:pimeloyl-ACP methyl ester carboxylesterase/DNA-binding CsgD family transcriptional regulator